MMEDIGNRRIPREYIILVVLFCLEYSHIQRKVSGMIYFDLSSFSSLYFLRVNIYCFPIAGFWTPCHAQEGSPKVSVSLAF